jgi:flagellar biosynthesis/type III secretory pathway chaperone
MTDMVTTADSGPPPAGLTPIVTELLGALGALQALLQRLTDLASQKLDTMRHADAGGLQSCTAMEHRLLAEVAGRQRERDAIVARLAQALQWPEATTASLAEIARHLPEPFSSYIAAKSRALGEIAGTLQQRNRLAASVARRLHAHVRSIFAELAKANQEPVVYGPSGQHEQSNSEAWVNAVG